MKRSFTLLAFGLIAGTSVFASVKSNDTVQQHLKAKMELMEKHISQLQQQIKTLETVQSNNQAQLKALQQTIAQPRTKQLVIDRRGSKQAWFK